MSINFKDRVSTYPNRYLATREDGTKYYVVLERADAPTTVGTLLNAATMNQLAALTDLDELPSMHLWKKHRDDPAKKIEAVVTDVQLGVSAKGTGAYGTKYYANSYSIDDEGFLVLNYPQSFMLGSLNSPDIHGKYFADNRDGNGVIYYIPEEASFYTDTTSSSFADAYMVDSATRVESNPLIEFVMADSKSAYTDGQMNSDGYWYVYTKRWGDCNGSVDSAAITTAVNAYLDEHPVEGGVTMDEVNAAIDTKIASAIGGSY